MRVKSYVWMTAILVCVAMLGLVVQAVTAPKPVKEKPQTVVMDPYAPVPVAPVQSETWPDVEAKRANERLAQQIYTRWQATGSATEDEKKLMETYIFSREHSGGGTGPLDSQGGPDLFGYRWVDNLGTDTATYAWIELRGDANAVWINSWSGSHDDSYSLSRFPFGFSFPFYTTTYDSFRLSTNGFIQFTTTSNSLSNACLPNTGVGGPAIFPYWDDLHLDYGGISTGTDVIGYRNFGTYTVIEFDSIGHCCSNGNASLKFEVILYSNGKMKMQYNTLVTSAAYDSTQTIGIQANGAAGSSALTYVCNLVGTQPSNGLAIWFYPPPGLAHNFACAGVSSPTGGNYQPGSMIPVTFDAVNFGLTTEASPVKYRFNGGTIFTENTASLPRFGTETHTFAQQIFAPATVGDYPLDVWTALTTDQDHSNDSCHVIVHVRNCVDFTMTAPGTASGNTSGAGDDCNLRTGDDQVVQVTIPHDGAWTFSMCGGSPSWDTYMFLTSTCCGGTTIASNDDGCGGVGFSKIACQNLTAGTYFVDIEPFSSGTTGAWVLDVTECVPCLITSQPGDVSELAENPADTTFYRTDPDGGCNSSPAAFGTINCGQTVFGRVFTYTGPGGASRADSDWYAINVAVSESLVVDIISEVPVRFGIVKYGHTTACDSSLLWIASFTSSDSCTHHIVTSPECRVPGLYALLVVPTVTTGLTTPREYRMSLNCTPCVVPPPPSNDNCATAAPFTVPANDSTWITGSTNLADVTCTDTCDFVSASKDVFYRLDVSGCRLIEMKLEGSLNGTSGDMHIAVYAPGQCCPDPAMLCDDDWDNFDATGLTWATHMPPYSLSSWVADTFTTGSYIIRVGRYSTGSGSYSLVVYDDGASCTTICDSARDVTVLRVDPVRSDSCIEVRFTAPLAGPYEIWSTTDKTAPFTPGGVWTLEATRTVPLGNNGWRDPAALQPFKRYVVRHICL